MMIEKISIETKYITLGQFLKLANVFDSGGMIKHYIRETGVFVNGEKEFRRGRKLYPEDIVEIEDIGRFIVQDEKNN